jgi:molecular chaperone GrpE
MKDNKDFDKIKKDLVEKESTIETLNKKLKEKNKELTEREEKLDDYLEQLKRLQADFENFKKRSEKEFKDYVRCANEDLILKIIDVYEDLGRAIKAQRSLKDLSEGLEITYNKLKNILEKEGLKKIQTEGEKFDPFKHEALMTENNEQYEDGIVTEELSSGYTLNSKVIKYSKVRVCKK